LRATWCLKGFESRIETDERIGGEVFGREHVEDEVAAA
jgi:hypothetical protein